jgi:hypothetical protein
MELVQFDIAILPEEKAEITRNDKDCIVEYMSSAPSILRGPGFLKDELNPTAGRVVPIGFSSDGIWVWPSAALYYFDRYGVRLPKRFTDHVLAATVPPEFLDRSTIDSALTLVKAGTSSPSAS